MHHSPVRYSAFIKNRKLEDTNKENDREVTNHSMNIELKIKTIESYYKEIFYQGCGAPKEYKSDNYGQIDSAYLGMSIMMILNFDSLLLYIDFFFDSPFQAKGVIFLIPLIIFSLWINHYVFIKDKKYRVIVDNYAKVYANRKNRLFFQLLAYVACTLTIFILALHLTVGD